MKLYIFVTENIKGVGGVQCYVAAKSRYLEEKGWTVKVISFVAPGVKKCMISSLDKYLNDGVFEICQPPSLYPKWFQRRVQKKLLKIVGLVSSQDEIILESHNAATSQWGELLSANIGARHYVYCMNEHYRGPGKHYEEKMDFYLFKNERREIIASKKAVTRLLEGYCEVKEGQYPEQPVIDEAPIQDVESPLVDSLQKMDWNICYLGRGNKPYVKNIITGIGFFSGLHSDKKIQLIVVGDIDMHRKLINDVLNEHPNLRITEMGFLFPLPRKLYDKIDVVIAGAGSARHSAEVGALVIIADTETKMANGLLGYETMNATYKGDDSIVSSFEDALERILVKRIQDQLPNRYPKRAGVEECIKQNFELFAKSERKKEYYPEKKMMEGKRDWKKFLGIFLISYFPFSYKFVK